MPLRDHFHAPLTNRHSWDELHGGWPMVIVQKLSAKLPARYSAAPTVHLGSAVEVDVGTFEYEHSSPSWLPQHTNGIGAATKTWTEPTAILDVEIPDTDSYEVRIYDDEKERQLVAAIEIISPANKDRLEHRLAFLNKCAALLRQNVAVTIIDIVTSRDFNLFGELLNLLGQREASQSLPPGSIYAVSCRATLVNIRHRLDIKHLPLQLGEALPTMPLWLPGDVTIPLELEASYEECCRALRIA